MGYEHQTKMYIDVDIPVKTYYTVYYTVSFQRCKLLKYSGIASAVNFYKAKEVRSNRAGQARISLFNVVSGWLIGSIVINHDPAWPA